MKDIAQLLDDPEVTIAVVGATDNSSKYGYVIYRDLKNKGYTVYPVNKQRKTVDGDPAFSTVADLPVTPTIINIVVPPEETTFVLRQCLQLGLRNVWVQLFLLAEPPHPPIAFRDRRCRIRSRHVAATDGLVGRSGQERSDGRRSGPRTGRAARETPPRARQASAPRRDAS